MSVFAESVPPAPLRDRSIEARRAARQAKARRERRIVDLLNRGVSVAEIAAREEVTEKRMRSVVSEILARRMPEPPAEFLALQVSRLSEALLVAYSAMSGANLRAVDRVVKIVRELDRYHGFSASRSRVLGDAPQIEHEDRLALAARASRPETAPQVFEKAQIPPGNGVAPDPQDAAPAQVSPALDPPPAHRPEMAPQAVEKSESAPGNGAAPDASDPQDAAPIGGEASASFLETPAQESFALDAAPTDRPEMAPQAAEKAESAPGNGGAAEASDPQDAAMRGEAFAPGLEPPTQESLALDAPPTNRPETAPQAAEKVESAPGNGAGAVWQPPLGGPSFVSPAVVSPGAFRRVNVRATLNGVAAC